MFADGTWDRKGLPRRVNVAATRIKRKTKADCDQITIESDSDRPRVKKIKSQAPPTVISISDSDHHETRASPLPKRTLPRRNRKGGKPALLVQLDESDKELKDGVSSASGSDFAAEKDKKGNKKHLSDAEEDSTTSEGELESEDGETAGTRKRKHTGKVSSRAAKKRVVVEVPRATALAAKNKGKATVRSKMQPRKKVASPASSEDEKLIRGGVSAPRIAPPADMSQPVLATTASRTSGQSVPAPQVVPVAPETQPVKQPQVAQPAPVVARPKPRMVAKKDGGLPAETEANDPFSLRQRKDHGSATLDTIAAPREDNSAVLQASVNNASADKPASMVSYPIREAIPAAVEDAPPKIVTLPAPAKTAEVFRELAPAPPIRPPQDSAHGTTTLHVAPAGLVPLQNTAHNAVGAGHAVPQVSGNPYAQGWPQGEDPRLQALANALAAQLLRGMPFPFPTGQENGAPGP